MKTERNILAAFVLNLAFAILEFFGGMVTGSVAIMSDAVHDTGDALSIGISYLLEKKSKKKPDKRFTYGYARYSVFGGLITTGILFVGSLVMIYNAIGRLITPAPIHYDGMLGFAVVGVGVNLAAAFFTRENGSVNQRAVNLHMLEDVLGWGVVLAGAVIMRFTDLMWIDPIMSVGLSLFILVNSIRNLKEISDLFLEKAPHNIDIDEIREHIMEINGVLDVHHIHIWSIDGRRNLATMHIVTDCDPCGIKEKIRQELGEHGIAHSTLELEISEEHCHEQECCMEHISDSACMHHHHGHHSH